MKGINRKRGKSSPEHEASAWMEHVLPALGSGWPSFIIVAAFLLLVGSLVVSTLSSVESRILHRSGEQLMTQARGIRGAHALWAEGRRGDLRALAASPMLSGGLARLADAPENAETKQMLKRRIETHVNAFDFPSTALLLDQSGRPVAVAGPISERARNFPTTFPERYERLRRGAVEFVISDESPTIHTAYTSVEAIVAAPMLDDDGQFVGAVVWDFDPTSGLNEISSLGTFGRTSRAYVFDREGQVVAGHDRAPGEPIREDRESHPNLLVTRTLEGSPGTFLDEYPDSSGTMVIGASLWDDQLDLGIGAEITHDEAFEVYFELRNVVLGSLVTMAALSLALLTILGNARTRVVRGLESSRARLEQLVDERTSSLADLNRELRMEAEQRMRHAWELETAREALEVANRKLEIIASKDALTGLANRRAFEITLEREWQRAMRSRTPVALLMIDVDDFKSLNDTQGHPAGDDALRRIGATLRAGGFARRPGDLISRVGGEEFALLLEDAPIERAESVAAQVREAILAERIEHPSTCVEGLDVVSVSVGAASLIPRSGEDPDFLVALADKALYRAKNEGRNRVVTSALDDRGEPLRGRQAPPHGGHAPEA
jgi:diguanylate cyclase (GGDEF)-like protein